MASGRRVAYLVTTGRHGHSAIKRAKQADVLCGLSAPELFVPYEPSLAALRGTMR